MPTMPIDDSMRMTVAEVFHLWFAGHVPAKLVIN